ncbi:hypothetical protein ACN9RQ_002371 [Vibrio parahaemolyticus]|nr:hypothetical protein [Vibrio parahaemolyticus]MBE4282853.1 hypothetical protein [Vibrio parahaemolyticus]
MKELVAAITHTATNRLKAPVLGSFILSWIAVNHSSLLIFLLSTSEQKIKLLTTESTFWTTGSSWFLSPPMMHIAYPVLLTIIYTFGLPFVQYLVDSLKLNFIDKKRIRKKHETDKFEYESQIEVSRAQAKSNVDYQRNLLSRSLDKWEEQRTAYENDIANLRETRDSLQQQLNASNSSQMDLSEELENLRQSIYSLKSEYNENEMSWTERLKQQSDENKALHTDKENLEQQLEESRFLQEQEKELHSQLEGMDNQLQMMKSEVVSTRTVINNILLLSEDFINFIDSETILSQTHENDRATYLNVIAPPLKEALQPLKHIVQQEKSTLDKARRKSSIESQVMIYEKQMEELKKNLIDFEQKGEQQIEVWN